MNENKQEKNQRESSRMISDVPECVMGEKVQNEQQDDNDTSEKECCRHKHRENKELRGLLNRLNRIEGQVRGVKTMVEEERYCVDILTQVMAIQAALNSFNKVLLANHIKSCVLEDIQAGREEALDELCETIQKLMK